MLRGSSKLNERGMEETVMVVDAAEEDGIVAEDMVVVGEEVEVVEVRTGAEEGHGTDDTGSEMSPQTTIC